MGLFGMAQVIVAKTYGIVVVTEWEAEWDPPRTARSNKELLNEWSLDPAPEWFDIPLAIAYQAAAKHVPASADGSKGRKGNEQQTVYRLRLILVRVIRWGPGQACRYHIECHLATEPSGAVAEGGPL